MRKEPRRLDDRMENGVASNRFGLGREEKTRRLGGAGSSAGAEREQIQIQQWSRISGENRQKMQTNGSVFIENSWKQKKTYILCYARLGRGSNKNKAWLPVLQRLIRGIMEDGGSDVVPLLAVVSERFEGREDVAEQIDR
jgi:hypothetical protein